MKVDHPCKHYDREEINLVLDGKTAPVLRCKDCGLYFVGGEWTEVHVL